MKKTPRRYTKRKGMETAKFYTDVPVSIIPKLDKIAALDNKTKTKTLEDLIKSAYAAECQVDNIELLSAENSEQNSFVEDYIVRNFGSNPADVEKAQSAALDAYWKGKGYVFGEDDETFILPT